MDLSWNTAWNQMKKRISMMRKSFIQIEKKPYKLRKHTLVFCFNNCAAKSEDKFVLVWLKCCPSYRSRKKGIEGKFFEAEAVGRGWEMFPRFPFFYWSTLDNTEIRLGPNLYERRGKHNYWNRILFSFVWLFRRIYKCFNPFYMGNR